MKLGSEALSLQQVVSLCSNSRLALKEAFGDVVQRDLIPIQPCHPSKHVDWLAFSYRRLREVVRVHELPVPLHAKRKEAAHMSTLDRLYGLDQVGWFQPADEWTELRVLRNEDAIACPATAD